MEQLENVGVPLSTVDCNACTEPCEGQRRVLCAQNLFRPSDILAARPEHVSYPAKFDIDFESDLLGSVKAFRRQVRGKPAHASPSLWMHNLFIHLDSHFHRET